MFSPQLSDRLILSRALRPATNDVTGLVADEKAREFSNQAAIDLAGKSLGLGERRLAENSRQFGADLGLAKSQMNYGKNAGLTATRLAGLGLGVSALDDMAARNRHKQRLSFINDMIGRYEKRGDENSLFFANMLNYMKNLE